MSQLVAGICTCILLHATSVQYPCSMLSSYNDCKRRNNYQRSLCIQNVIWFNGISINVIPFTSLSTVRPSLHRFSNLTYKCSTASHADVGQRHCTISVNRYSSIPVQPIPCISLTRINTNSSLAMSNFNQDLFSICGGNTVAIMTRYGLDGPGIESR